MAKQNGLVRLVGNVGDMTYYRSKDGYFAREKTSLTGDRIATDPKFKRTRENMTEFGSAGKAGKTLRDSISLLLKNAKDGRLISRLCKTMMQVLKADTVNKRGQRKVSAGDINRLVGFEFNANAVLNTTLFAPYTTNMNRQSGALNITIPAFKPSSSVIAPEGATHFKFVSAGAAINFDTQVYTSGTSESAVLPWDENTTTDITLSNTVTAGSTLPLFLVLGIQFYQEVNGSQYALTNSSFNALSIVDLSKA